MKKLMTTCILALTSLAAFAGAPAVGDYATFDFTANGMQGTIKYELASFDSSSNIFVRKTTTTYNGQSTVAVENVAADDIPTSESLNFVLALCETPNLGGTLEQLVTPVGTLDTCALPAQTGGTVNVGVVPFGTVKVNTAEVTMMITGFHFVNP